MRTLRKDHFELYKSVRLKSVIFLLIGLALLFGRIPVNSTPELVQQFLLFNLAFWIVSFLITSIGIAVGTLIEWKNYIVAKIFLAFGAATTLTWITALFVTLFNEPQSPSASFLLVIVLWSYFAYHLFRVVFDKEWVRIELENK
jgi:hypothetical protein